MIGIYKITNPKGKIYIGQSINIEKRWKAHFNKHSKKTILIHNSIKKYGPENHKFEIIEECILEQLNEREVYWVSYHNAIHPYGLVLKVGSSNNSLISDITKLKMSKAHTGKKDSEETKLKKSKAAKGKTKTDIWRNNISKSHPTKKPVEQYDLKNNKINEFISINEASRNTNIRVSDISACCNNKQKTAFGYKWKFKNNN
jgi:group I intron endonuclease